MPCCNAFTVREPMITRTKIYSRNLDIKSFLAENIPVSHNSQCFSILKFLEAPQYIAWKHGCDLLLVIITANTFRKLSHLLHYDWPVSNYPPAYVPVLEGFSQICASHKIGQSFKLPWLQKRRFSEACSKHQLLSYKLQNEIVKLRFR